MKGTRRTMIQSKKVVVSELLKEVDDSFCAFLSCCTGSGRCLSSKATFAKETRTLWKTEAPKFLL